MNPSGSDVIRCREQGRRGLLRLKSCRLWRLERLSVVLPLLDVARGTKGTSSTSNCGLTSLTVGSTCKASKLSGKRKVASASARSFVYARRVTTRSEGTR